VHQTISCAGHKIECARQLARLPSPSFLPIAAGDIMESPGPDVCGRIIMAKASAEPY
jgi:hypothetical protein